MHMAVSYEIDNKAIKNARSHQRVPSRPYLVWYNNLTEARVPLTDPAVEFGYSHGCARWTVDFCK